MPLSGGRRTALREGRHAVELLPVKKDPINGMVMIKYLAMIAAWVDEKELACEQLATAVRCPTGGMDLSYGELKLMPFGTRCAAIRASKKSSPLSRRSSKLLWQACRLRRFNPLKAADTVASTVPQSVTSVQFAVCPIQRFNVLTPRSQLSA